MDDVSRFHGLTRSQLMSRIRSRGNKKTELVMALLLRSSRIRGWRRHQPILGRPDFVFRKERLALFVDGCFWHGCRKHYRPPNTRGQFWKGKVETNRARDRRINRGLRRQGWNVLRFWEHDLRESERVIAR